MSPRPPRTRAIIDRGRRRGADRRRRVRRPPVAAEQATRSTADIANGVLVDNSDPRFLRGKIEAIGADVLYGVGAIVAMTAVFGFFAHGPDSTAVADHKKISLSPDDGTGRRRASRCGGSSDARACAACSGRCRRRARGRRAATGASSTT